MRPFEQPGIWYEINGLGPLFLKLGAAEDMHKTLRQIYNRWGFGVVRNHLYGKKQYPPKPPGSDYQRTFRLANNWKWKSNPPEGTTLTMSIYNKTAYAEFVVGNEGGERQAWMHAGRWWKVHDRVTEQLPKLIAKVQEHFETMWEQ